MKLVNVDEISDTTIPMMYLDYNRNDWVQCKIITKDAPEVEAIPKKWIINWLTKQTIPATHTCDDYEAVEMMLDDWEKENEANAER